MPKCTCNALERKEESFDQAESIGEICGGFAFAILAQAAGISITLITSAALIAFTGALVARSGNQWET